MVYFYRIIFFFYVDFFCLMIGIEWFKILFVIIFNMIIIILMRESFLGSELFKKMIFLSMVKIIVLVCVVLIVLSRVRLFFVKLVVKKNVIVVIMLEYNVNKNFWSIWLDVGMLVVENLYILSKIVIGRFLIVIFNICWNVLRCLLISFIIFWLLNGYKKVVNMIGKKFEMNWVIVIWFVVVVCI